MLCLKLSDIRDCVSFVHQCLVHYLVYSRCSVNMWCLVTNNRQTDMKVLCKKVYTVHKMWLQGSQNKSISIEGFSVRNKFSEEIHPFQTLPDQGWKQMSPWWPAANMLVPQVFCAGDSFHVGVLRRGPKEVGGRAEAGRAVREAQSSLGTVSPVSQSQSLLASFLAFGSLCRARQRCYETTWRNPLSSG